MTKNSSAQITQALGNVLCINSAVLVAIFYSEQCNKKVAGIIKPESYCEDEVNFKTSRQRVTTIPLEKAIERNVLAYHGPDAAT